MNQRLLCAVLLALPLLGAIASARAPQDQAAPQSGAEETASAASETDFCAPFAKPGPAAAATRGAADRTTIQAGLRVYFGVDAGFLSDGIIGPETVSFLRQLCEQIPLAGGKDAIPGTLDVARSFGTLSGQSPNWRGRLIDPDLLGAAENGRVALRLAGGGGMAAGVFNGAEAPSGCDALETHDFSGAELTPAQVQAGIAALAAVDPDLDVPDQPDAEPGLGPQTRAGLAAVCARYPVTGGADALAAALDRLGAIEAALPGAIAQIASAGFAAWLAEEPVRRIPRLLGSAPAALALLAEYRAGEVPPLRMVATDGPACRRAVAAGPEPVHYSLTNADLEALSARTGIRAVLEPLSAERHAHEENLKTAVTAALGLDPASCAAQVAAHVIDENSEQAQVFSLDPEAVKALALKPELAETLGALSDLTGIEAASRDDLEAAVEAAVRDTIAGAQEEVAGAAAEAAAAAAEDVSPAPDMAAPDFDFFEPEERPQEFAITDSSLVIIEAEVTDEAFREAINATPYNPVQSRDMVRADMLLALRPVVAARTETAAQSQLGPILETIRQQWRLDEALISSLAVEPEFAAVTPETLAAAEALAGIAYPDQRLFDLALESLSPPPGAEARAVFDDVARKRVDDPHARRAIAPVAADCGCNVTREANAVVYGFYPFWMFPEDTETEVPKIEFETVSRIAFDGLEIDGTGQIRYAAQWRDAGATFVASAHRHEARADVAVRLSGWRGWSDDARRTAADSIERLLRPQPEEALLVSGGPLGGLDHLLSRTPDGVTLFFEGYDGSTGSADPENLRALVRTLAERLDGTGQSINLAFDIPLASGDGPDAPLFRDLHALIVNTEEPADRIVNHVLVFLERPTSEAKKRLRARIENSFRGEERIQVLRSIIPVVPAGANAPLDHSQDAGPDYGGQTTSATNSYGQFDDDLVYFQDNFDGVGFWPAPIAGAVLPDGTPDRLTEIVQARYYEWTPPLLPDGSAAMLRTTSDRVCRVVCPNRIAFYGLTLGVLGLAATLSVLTFYSGRVRSLCETLLLVPILLFVALGLLVLIAICDAGNRQMAVGAAVALVALMCAAAGFGWYERRLDGPMP